MKVKHLTTLLFSAALMAACQQGNKTNQQTQMEKFNEGTFGYDLDFLKERDSIIILKDTKGSGQVLVSVKYQGKVFTSTADGLSGQSFGWINYKAFDEQPNDHMNAYGGEDRLWLGPEGGKFSIFFKPGAKMEFENWHTPPAIDTESWSLVSADSTKVKMSKNMTLQNYAGTELRLKVDREVQILEKDEIERSLGTSIVEDLKSVGFKTSNDLTNTGDREWTRQTGAPCMWSLNMFTPSPETVIVVPYEEKTTGKVATTDYFGEIPADRVKFENGILFFKADGKSRGKLGLSPQRAKDRAGSYDAANKVLTITLYTVDNTATYLNQEWTTEKDPFMGDAVNAYNDGPLEDGSQMGPFYEIESVSPAAFLKPGASLSHNHSVFHFSGPEASLESIAKEVLGVSLKNISTAFNQ